MLQENIFQEAPHLNKKSHRLLTFSRRILDSKQRILQSPMPNEHPVIIRAVTKRQRLRISLATMNMTPGSFKRK